MQNGRSTKKQKYTDKNQFKGKESEPSKRGRPKKNKNNPQEDTRRTRIQDKRQSTKTKSNIKNPASLNNGLQGKVTLGFDVYIPTYRVMFVLAYTLLINFELIFYTGYSKEMGARFGGT